MKILLLLFSICALAACGGENKTNESEVPFAPEEETQQQNLVNQFQDTDTGNLPSTDKSTESRKEENFDRVNKEIDALNEQIKVLENERNQLKEQYNQLAQEKNELQGSYNDFKRKKNELQANYNNLNQQKDQLQNSYDNLSREIDEIRTRHNKILDRYSKRKFPFNEAGR